MDGYYELFKKYLLANTEIGQVQWRNRVQNGTVWNRRYCGKQCFNTRNNSGQLFGKLEGSAYLKKHVIWTLHYGEYPRGKVYHINGDLSDCSIGNLAMKGVDRLLDVL